MRALEVPKSTHLHRSPRISFYYNYNESPVSAPFLFGNIKMNTSRHLLGFAFLCTRALLMLAPLVHAQAPKPLWMQPRRVSVQGISFDMSNGGVNGFAPDLPRPAQQSRRMLVMINAYHFNASESHVINSLETFTNWCEQGHEVHVSLDTASPH